MQKHLSFKIQKPPSQTSPDNKRMHLVKNTESPVKEIEKFLAIKEKSIRSIPGPEKIIPTNDRNSNFRNASQKYKEEQYKKKIRELQDQVVKYKGYFEQCKILTEKNLVLKEQVELIMDQLESRYQQSQYSSPANNFQPHSPSQNPPLNPKLSLHTLQSSIEAPNNSLNTTLSPRAQARAGSNFGRVGSPSQKTNQEIEELYNYINNLETTLKQVLEESHHFKAELKKEVKKDMNQMEQKLMGYILGLEDKVSEATLRNLGTRTDRTDRDKSDRGKEKGAEELEYENGKSLGNSNDNFNNTGRSQLGSKKDSIISMMNLQISSSSNAQKQERIIQQTQINSSSKKPKCQSCLEYLDQIQFLTEKCRNLQQQIKRYKSHSQTNEKINRSKDPKSKPRAEDVETETEKSKKLQSRLNLLQSNINILVQSSGEDSVVSDPKQKIQMSLELESSQPKLDKIKQQLITIMQDLQSIVHQCEYENNNMESKENKVKNINMDLNSKIREQIKYIGQLQEEVTRLRMEVEEGKTSREKLEKFMKLQVREEEEVQAPYFRTIKDPISCIDHNATKGKLNHIITEIKKFQTEIEVKDKDKDKEQNTILRKESKQPSLTF